MSTDSDLWAEDWEERLTFVGPCTCDHEPGEHGWAGCEVEDCECEAAWEE